MRDLIISRILPILFAIALLYFGVRIFIYHGYLATFPYGITYREGAMMSTTTALVNGQNPFSFALQPQYTNEYGFVYPLCVWPLAQIFGTTVVIHRIVTGLFILLSCVLIFFVMKRMKIPLLLNMAGVLMLYASLLFPGTSTPCSDPASTALFFMLLTIFIPWFFRYSYTSLAISILCGLLAFYSKPYFLLGLPIMGSYLLLFVSKKKGLFYGAAALLSSLLSIVLINAIFPAYFGNCFFAWLSIAPAWSTMERLYSQIHSYISLHRALLLVSTAIIGYFIWQWFNLKHNLLLTLKEKYSLILSSIDWRDLKAPLFKINFHLIIYAEIWFVCVLVFCLGKHGGATLWYFFQLLSPFFLISVIWLCSRIPWWIILCTPFLYYNLTLLTSDEKHEWFNPNAFGIQESSQLITNHQKILASPLFAPLLIAQNKEVFDNGQSEDFLSGGKRSPLLGKFFKEDQRVYNAQFLYIAKLERMVQQKDFDLILIQASYSPNVPESIKAYYNMDAAFFVYTPQDRRPYMITSWTPKK